MDGVRTFESLKSLPKIDLHRHLEGSLRLETLVEIANEYKLDVPAYDLEGLRPFVQVTDDPADYEIFLSKFEVLRRFYCSPEAIQRLAYEVVADAAADNVHYLELRFSPQALAKVRGFALSDVTDWVIDAVGRASRDHNIKVSLIVTLVRHDPFEQAYQVAKTAFDRAGQGGIVGLDLAGDEVKYPPMPFQPIFKQAKKVGLGVTIHAGEWASAEGVKQAVEALYADRIGHGVRAVENSHVLRMLKERNIVLEVCLTSNLQTGVVHEIGSHPLMDFLDFGVEVTVNTDDPSISHSVLSEEYEIAMNQLSLTTAQLHQTILSAARSAFLPSFDRDELVRYFEAQLAPFSLVDPL